MKRQFGKAVFSEVLDKVLKETSTKALEENKIKPAGQPKLDLKTYGEGKELDHLFSNFLKLSSFKHHGIIKWITRVENIFFNTQMVVEVEKNKVFSILPLSDLDSLTIKGSKWDILNEDIPYGSSRTLRNITLSNEIEVHCKNGNFCLIIKN